jgi:predicted enzyme related to lactoylglutathione lyase
MINNITIGDISIDCTDPERTRDFYASLTGWEKRETYGPALVCDNGLILLFTGCDFEYVPSVWPEEPGEQQKQMHFDFGVDDLPSAVEEAIRLGATRAAVQYDGERYVTMIDPEGHPFCLCQRKQDKSEFDLYFERKGYGTIPDPGVNIDCPDTKRLREFYAQLTDWDSDFHWTALLAENGTVVHFMQSDFDYIPPVWPEEPGKQQKQMHFNFGVDDLPSAVEEAIRLGATKAAVQYDGERYVTMIDPEGHPFCLRQR